jgi:L-lactate dehydrogenase complex protein LldF
VRIDIPRMLVELREHLDRDRIAPWRERLLFGALGRVLSSPALFRLAGRIGRLAQKPFVSGGRLRRLPLVLGRWTRSRDLPPVAAKTFSERWKELNR